MNSGIYINTHLHSQFFFSVFAIFPDWVGLNLWNLMNVLLLLAAVYYLPYLSNYQKGLILLITMFELLTSVQNEQSNGLMAGLLIFAFAFLEKDKPLLATFCIVFSAFIKLFSIVGFVLFLFYPKKLKSILFSFIWTCILLLIPLVYIDLEQYKFLINSYLNLLSNDHSISLGYSVMGWLSTWFSLDINKNIIVLIGAIIFILPFSKVKMYKEVAFRYLALTSVLLWVIIFNHKAESPTFVIAVSGVAIWFILSKKNLLNYILFFSAIILTILSPTDLFPPFIRNEFFKPFVVKVVPCILIWLKIVYEMLAMKKDNLSNYPFLCFSKDSL